MYMLVAAITCTSVHAAQKPNVVLYFADDISAREFPVYGSSVWTDPLANDTSDVEFRAKTPVIDRIAKEGCWIETAWASTICSPSRAMMMTGRYAHLHKWWHNKDKGEYIDKNGNRVTWPLYESSPLQIGHLAQQAGYGTYWAGKTQMAGDYMRFGFDEGCFTPGKLSDTDNPYTDFKHEHRKINGVRTLVNADTGKPTDTYWQNGWYWYPHVRLMNDPSAPGKLSWWPNSPESEKTFGLNTYGPDVELDFVFNFMERKQEEGKPFFIYHCSHLGHDAFNWFFPDSPSRWPGTPIVRWDGNQYIRTEPNVTGDKGVYDTHDSITESGIHNHVNYIDYQIWLYLQKFKEMGIEKDTVFIFCTDNGTSGYGKGNPDRQRGTHVPFLIYAPGVETSREGKQEVLVDLSDVLPTLAEIMGATVPDDYEINGQSFWPWFLGDQAQHRDWIYSYHKNMQFIRNGTVMKDGRGNWWDVSERPADWISFRQIKNWKAEPPKNRNQRRRLSKILPQFDLHSTEHDAPEVAPKQSQRSKRKQF